MGTQRTASHKKEFLQRCKLPYRLQIFWDTSLAYDCIKIQEKKIGKKGTSSGEKSGGFA